MMSAAARNALRLAVACTRCVGPSERITIHLIWVIRIPPAALVTISFCGCPLTMLRSVKLSKLAFQPASHQVERCLSDP